MLETRAVNFVIFAERSEDGQSSGCNSAIKGKRLAGHAADAKLNRRVPLIKNWKLKKKDLPCSFKRSNYG